MKRSSGIVDSGRTRPLPRDLKSFEMLIVLFESYRLFFSLYFVISFSIFLRNVYWLDSRPRDVSTDTFRSLKLIVSFGTDLSLTFSNFPLLL